MSKESSTLFTRLRKLRQAWSDRRDCAALRARVAAIDETQAVVTFTPEGVILDANDNFLRLVGYTREQVVGQHHRLFMADEDRDSATYLAFWQALAEGKHQSGQFRRLAADGRELWIQGSYSPILNRLGRVHRVVKHAIDITAQRQAEADMQGRLDAIHRAMAVITFDLDGNVTLVNDNFLAATGYRRDEVIGRHHRIFVEPKEHESAAYREFWARLHRGEYNAGLFKRVRRDGSPLWLQASYNPILDASGRPFKVVKLATDVTRQTQATQALRHTLEQLGATVPAIAGEAQTASRLAAEATSSANAGGELVERLVHDIEGINEHSRAMREIIAVMNSIAFQTNILSLNAAVEAAHAGELGRGFAVVAQEVRALAQRSAESAREIHTLVQNTTDALAGCVSHATHAGEAMHTITGSSSQVAQLIRDIASEARSQADGLGHASRTLDQLKVGSEA